MNISENSRVWIYQSDRALSVEEQNQVQDTLNAFTAQWLAHGYPLTAAAEIRNDRFIILSVDEQQVAATGCAISASVKVMQEIEQKFNINVFDRFNIAYRDQDQIRAVGRQEFETLIKTGAVTEDTLVFNNLVENRKQLETHWEIPFKQSWHARFFG